MKIKVELHTGYCGMDKTEFYDLGSEYTEDELAELCMDLARDNAEMYGIYVAEEADEDDDESTLSYSIEGSWELYDAEKHGTDIEWNKL